MPHEEVINSDFHGQDATLLLAIEIFRRLHILAILVRKKEA